MEFVVVCSCGKRKTVRVDSIYQLESMVNRALSNEATDDNPVCEMGVSHVLIDLVRVNNREESALFFNGVRYFKNYVFNC